MHARGRDKFNHVYYGRYGTPTTFALEETVASAGGSRQGGGGALRAGCHRRARCSVFWRQRRSSCWMVDTVYEPTRFLCDTQLEEVRDHDHLLRPADRCRHRCAYPTQYYKSYTWRAPVRTLRDPGRAGDRRRRRMPRRCVVVMDNTWASPLYFKPYRHGVDLVVHAATELHGRPFRRDDGHHHHARENSTSG